MTIAERVASRFKKARGVPMGTTAEKGKIRVHRYRDNLRIWDLTNAGKRGKKVQTMYLATSYSYKGDEQKWLDRMSAEALDYGNYDRFTAFVSDMQADYPGEIEMSESQKRGIDVLPADAKTFKMSWTVGPSDKLELKATPLEFQVSSHHFFAPGEGHMPANAKGFWQSTTYWPAKKADAKKFYAWLSENESAVKKMDITALRDMWKKLGVRYDYH